MKKLLGSSLIFVLIFSTFTGFLASAAMLPSEKIPSKSISEKLDPRLYEWLSSPSRTFEDQPYEGFVKVMVVSSAPAKTLAGVASIKSDYPIGDNFLISGFVKKDQLTSLASDSSVIKVIPDKKIDLDIRTPPMRGHSVTEHWMGIKEIRDRANTEKEIEKAQPTLWNATTLIGAQEVWETLGYDGSGTRIAIVDTGVDFGNPDLTDALARFNDGRPMMLDADGFGLVVFPLRFAARVVDGQLTEWSGNVPEWADGVVLYNSSSGSFYLPTMGLDPLYYDNWFFGLVPYSYFWGPIWKNFAVGDATHFVAKRSGTYTLSYNLGFMMSSSQMSFAGYSFVLAQNSTGLFRQVHGLNPATLDFTDPEGVPETAHSMGDGTEVIAWHDVLLPWMGDDFYGSISLGTIGGSILLPKPWPSSLIEKFLGRTEGMTFDGMDYQTGLLMVYMTDSIAWDGGHGTSCAAVAASRGVVDWGLPDVLRGVAPGAEIMPVLALWYGDLFYSWMWSAGFDYMQVGIENRWVYTGYHRADIISNSWGWSEWPELTAAAGFDPLSAYEDLLSLPGLISSNYPGTLFIHSMGNGGPGFATVTSPRGLLSLGVGASTTFHFWKYVGYDFRDGAYDDIIPWSDRGPAPTGAVKPDVVSCGAFNIVPHPVEWGYFDAFGGTSQSSPMTAGVAALVVQVLKEAGASYTPHMIKNIISGSAKGLSNEPVTQGSGRVNAMAAVGLTMNIANAEGTSTMFMVTTETTYDTLRNRHNLAMGYWTSQVTDMRRVPPRYDVPMTNVFTGYVRPGSSGAASLEVWNPSDTSLTIALSAAVPQLISEKTYTYELDADEWVDPYWEDNLYLNMTDEELVIPPDADLMVVTTSCSAGDYAIGDGDPNRLRLYLYDWIDLDGNGATEEGELSFITYAYAFMNTQKVEVNKPEKKFPNTPVLRLRYYASGGDLTNTAKVTVSFLKWAPWSWARFSRSSVTVRPEKRATVTLRVKAPRNAPAGMYFGFINVTCAATGQFQLMPVSLSVTPSLRSGQKIILGGDDPYQPEPLYNNGKMYGMGDIDWRYESGDWRIYHFYLSSTSRVSYLDVTAVWDDPLASVDVFVVDPHGFILAGNTYPGLYNWVHHTGFFFPGKTAPLSTTVMVDPSKTGIYTVIIHNTHTGTNENYPVGIHVVVQSVT